MSHSSKVLMVVQSYDPHADSICSFLEKFGVAYLRFNRFDEGYSLSYKYDANQRLLIRAKDQELEVNEKNVRSIFWRPKPVLSCETFGEPGTVEELYRSHEWRFALLGLLSFCKQAKWVNPYWNSHYMSVKAIQLQTASRIGLKVPKTIISNSSDDILTYLNNADKLIFKSLSSFSTSTKGIYTTRVDKQEIKSLQKEIAFAPGIFQEEIEKKYELRVNVVEDQIFTVKIDSQRFLETQLDWRHNQDKSIMMPYELGKETAELLLNFHKEAGLKYCAYDFIVNNKGEEIFIEANPSGQWLFLCDEVANEISKAIATSLVS